ncbi:hypothetical protein GH714_026006 [Hevea brasiliensis]|uniref:Uncharacterized protein n=1 Tax=Hevea brasiliensis TaxID=3981 RepID=A0A6A6MQD4_HEVBR|nr:hypothetical protein GH714_026006 [Hevea brasiliensis]
MNPYEKPLTPYERGSEMSNNNPSRNLHVSYPTSFKKTKGNKHGYQNAKNSTPSGSGSSRQPDPGPEWPINPPRPSSLLTLALDGLLLRSNRHAIAILRTKRKRAHRALGQVICRVLGWDFGRLPVVVLKDEPLSQSLASLGLQLNLCYVDGIRMIELSFMNFLQIVMVAFDGKNDESVMIEKESCLKEDANKKVVEDLDNGVSDMEGGKEGVMDYETLWGEPRGNAGNGNDDSGNAGSFCGNESELTLKENSDFHQENGITMEVLVGDRNIFIKKHTEAIEVKLQDKVAGGSHCDLLEDFHMRFYFQLEE